MQDARVPIPDGYITVWHRRGEPTAVLVHGLTGNSRWWTRVIEHLSDDVGLIALDVRGRGQSWDSPPPYGLATIADDIVRCLDHFDVERAVVAGYSMGGWVTALCGQNHPGRIERLVFVDGGFPMPTDPELSPEAAISVVVGPALGRLDIDFEDQAAYLEHWKKHPALSAYWEDDMAQALVYELAGSNGGLRVRANAEAIAITGAEITADPEANRAAANTTVPAHLLVVERGTMDQPGGMIPRAIGESAVASNPNLSMEYVEDVNHYTLMLGKGAPRVAAAITTAVAG